MRRSPPATFPKDWKNIWRKPDKTGFSNSLTEAASMQISPMLMKRIMMKREMTTYQCSFWFVKFYMRGNVRKVVTNRLITIPNFLRPYLTKVNFSTRGAVMYLKLKGINTRLKWLNTSWDGYWEYKRTTVPPKLR